MDPEQVGGHPNRAVAAGGQRRAEQLDWTGELAQATDRFIGAEVQELGELASDEEAGQLAFELNAMLFAANNAFLLYGDPAALDRARRGAAARLGFAEAR